MLEMLTDPRQLVGLALSANTMAVMWLAGSKRAIGWTLALIGQAGWLALIVLFDTWGLLPLTVGLTFVYTRNLIRWRREQQPMVGLTGPGRYTTGAQVIETTGLPEGEVPPSASLRPPRSTGDQT